MKTLKKIFEFFLIVSYFLILVSILYSEIKQAHWYSIQILIYLIYAISSFTFLLNGCKGHKITIKNEEFRRLDDKTRGIHFPLLWRIIWALIPLILFLLFKMNVDLIASIPWTNKRVTQKEFNDLFIHAGINALIFYVAWRYLESFLFSLGKFPKLGFLRRIMISHSDLRSVFSECWHYNPGQTITVYKPNTDSTQYYIIPTMEELEEESRQEQAEADAANARFQRSMQIQQQYNMEKENKRHAEEQARRDYERNRILEKQAREQEDHNRKMRKHAEEMERLARKRA